MIEEQKKLNLIDFDRNALESYFVDAGEKSFRAHQVLKWIYHRGVIDVEFCLLYTSPSPRD